MSVELLCYTETRRFGFATKVNQFDHLPESNLFFADFSPVEKVELIDCEGHLVVV